MGIDDDKTEILGRIGPLAQSLSGPRVWPYVVSSEACVRVSAK